ncbi:MAG TPA: peptidoglycan-binding domain-containing protein, partial [Acidimicrobiia bacterium]|nr:peptidoglycan-binding domain-containing protein [Acidimicrobiia bacterium]
MEQWFQNTRGLVIIVLAVITGAVLLAIEPGDGFPTSASGGSGGDTATVTTVTTVPQGTTTTAAAHPTIEQGTTDTANTTVLQQRLNALGYDVGNPDGVFGGGTKAQVVNFQTDKGITPADGVVDAATWDALLANPGTSPTTTTKAK